MGVHGVTASRGSVRIFHQDQGWGVIDSVDTPGGCWVHYSVIEMEGYRHLTGGALVSFDFERVAQDGYDYRATSVTELPDAEHCTVYEPTPTVAFDLPAVMPVDVIRPADRVPADPTSGMSRELAFETALLWTGQVTTDPGAVSGWHHHSRNESGLYVVSGVLRFEFEGTEGYVDAGPGDFIHVPAFTVHRESNPTGQPSVAVIARAGGGIPTVNVETPPAPHG